MSGLIDKLFLQLLSNFHKLPNKIYCYLAQAGQSIAVSRCNVFVYLLLLLFSARWLSLDDDADDDDDATRTTLTTSPYRSPKSIVAPSCLASAMDISVVSTVRFCRAAAFTIFSTCAICVNFDIDVQKHV